MNYVGSEHLALAIAHEGRDASTSVLSRLGISVGALRVVVRELLGDARAELDGPLVPRARKLVIEDFPATLRGDEQLLFLLQLQDVFADEDYQRLPTVQAARQRRPRDTDELTRMLVDLHIQMVKDEGDNGDEWAPEFNWDV